MNNNNNTPVNNPVMPQQNMPPQYRQSPPQYRQAPMPQYPPVQYAPYVPAARPFIKKVYSPLAKRDHTFMLLFLLCTVVFMDFAVFRFFHLGFTIAYYLLFGISTVYLWNKNEKPGLFSIICGLVSIAGAFTCSLYNNTLINTLMVFLTAGLFAIYCLGISGTFNRPQGNFKMLFDLANSVIVQPFENLSDVFGSIKAGAKKGKRSLSVFAGILVALPVLIVVITLLAKGDAAFEGLVKAIAKNIGLYIFELFLALLFTPLVFSYMFGKKHKLNAKQISPAAASDGKVSSVACISFLSVISFVYVVYLFSQLAYFFSAFSGLLPEDYEHTASAFARRGFFEMFAVVAINIIIISVVSAISKRNADGNVSMGIKVLSLFISMFSVLMIATAMQKMKLNIETYGLSRNRVLVSAFMIMMLFVIAFFIIHIFAPKVPYMQPIIVFCSVLFVALALCNVDSISTQYNVKAYTDGRLETVDIVNISDVGDGGVPALIKLTEAKDKKVAATAEMFLINYVSESDSFEIKDGDLRKKGSDFRKYFKMRDDAEIAAMAYYKELPAERKSDFVNKYNEGGFYYDDYDKSFFGGGKEYKYNASTNNYEAEDNGDYAVDEFEDED